MSVQETVVDANAADYHKRQLAAGNPVSWRQAIKYVVDYHNKLERERRGDDSPYLISASEQLFPVSLRRAQAEEAGVSYEDMFPDPAEQAKQLAQLRAQVAALQSSQLRAQVAALQSVQPRQAVYASYEPSSPESSSSDSESESDLDEANEAVEVDVAPLVVRDKNMSRFVQRVIQEAVERRDERLKIEATEIAREIYVKLCTSALSLSVNVSAGTKQRATNLAEYLVQNSKSVVDRILRNGVGLPRMTQLVMQTPQLSLSQIEFYLTEVIASRVC